LIKGHLRGGANVNFQNEIGETALISAAFHGQVGTIGSSIILKAGAFTIYISTIKFQNTKKRLDSQAWHPFVCTPACESNSLPKIEYTLQMK
jgi:hypothetical protein